MNLAASNSNRQVQYKNFSAFLGNYKSNKPEEIMGLKSAAMRSIINSYRLREVYNKASIFAYVGEQFPTELLLPFGMIALNIESIAIMLSQSTNAARLVDSAHENNLSSDICSYLRLPYGAMMEDIYPCPDIVISNSQPCDALRKLGYMASKKYNVPFLSLDTPAQVNDESISYLSRQIKNMLKDIESILHVEFSQELFKQAIQYSNELTNYYKKTVFLLQDHSLPEISRELQEIFGMNYMGIKESAILGKTLYEEALEIIKNEDRNIKKKRVLWLGQSPERTNELFQYLGKHVEVMFWSPMWEGTLLELDEEDPICSIAERAILFHWDGERMKKNVSDICKNLNLDGLIVSQVWGCRNMTGISQGIRDIANEHRVKHMTLAVDFTDRNNFSFTYAKNRIDAFLEIL